MLSVRSDGALGAKSWLSEPGTTQRCCAGDAQRDLKSSRQQRDRREGRKRNFFAKMCPILCHRDAARREPLEEMAFVPEQGEFSGVSLLLHFP